MPFKWSYCVYTPSLTECPKKERIQNNVEFRITLIVRKLNIIISIKFKCLSYQHNSESSLDGLRGQCSRPVRLRIGRIPRAESDELEMVFCTTVLKIVEDAHLLGRGGKSTQYLDGCTDILLPPSV